MCELYLARGERRSEAWALPQTDEKKRDMAAGRAASAAARRLFSSASPRVAGAATSPGLFSIPGLHAPGDWSRLAAEAVEK